jgi:hypothetical protein
MAGAPYDERSALRDQPLGESSRERSLGEHIFIWIAWALAAAFWGAVLTSGVGIVRAVSQPSPGPVGGVDAGGIGYLLMDVVGGMLLLGLAMAYGSWMFARRNRRLDPVSEAATAALYDRAEREGGADLTSRSPDLARERR